MSGDPEGKDDKDSPLGFDRDEAADYQDRVDEAMKEARDRGDDTDEIEDYFDRTVVREPLISPADRTQRDPIDVAKIAGIREFAPTPFPGADTPGGPPSVTEERIRGLDLKDGRLFDNQDLRTYDRGLNTSIGRTPRIDRKGGIGSGALFGDADTDIFESDLNQQIQQAAQAQGMTQYGFNPAEQVVEGARSQVYNVASDFDGGDVGDFSEFLPPDVQDKERERQGEIRKAVEEGRPIPGEAEIGLRNLLQPLGLARTIIEDFSNRDQEFARQANLAGNQLQTNDQGQITGVYNPQENIVYTPSSVGLFNIKGQEEAAGDLYKLQRQRRNEDREARNQENDSTSIIPPLIPESAVAEPQQPDVGQNVITEANYQPRDSVQYAYTGLPTLAPVSLQPSFRSPQQFSPAYGLSALRRS